MVQISVHSVLIFFFCFVGHSAVYTVEALETKLVALQDICHKIVNPMLFSL